jgi:hypothetical protein
MSLLGVLGAPVIPGLRSRARGQGARRAAIEALSLREGNVLKLIADIKSNDRGTETIDIAPDRGMQSEDTAGQVARPR